MDGAYFIWQENKNVSLISFSAERAMRRFYAAYARLQDLTPTN